MARCSSTPSGEVPSGSASAPALLTSTSTGPIPSANARTDDRSATSSSPSSTSPCIWSAAALPRSRLRTASTTRAPRSASTLAVSRPIPPLAPVTTNRRPSWRGTSRQCSVLKLFGVPDVFAPARSASTGDFGGELPATYATGSPRVTVRPTVQSRSWICWMVRGRISRAASPPSPSGKVTSRVTVSWTRWLPPSSRILWPSARAWNVSNGARLPAMWSRSAAPQPTRAASSSSTGVKSGSPPGPIETPPPRPLVAFQRCSPIWWRSTLRRVWSFSWGPSSAAMSASLPEPHDDSSAVPPVIGA